MPVGSEPEFTPAELKWAEQGAGYVGLGVAEMDFGTAPEIIDAVRQALGTGVHGYLAPARSAATRIACARWQADRYGWSVDPEMLRLAPDAATAMFRIVAEYIDVRWPLLIMTPAYPKFFAIASSLGRRAVAVDLMTGPGGYSYDLDRIEDVLRRLGPCLVILCNPQNPTGYVAGQDELAQIARLLRRYGGLVLSDEVYAPLTYPSTRHVVFASLVHEGAADVTFTITSASKAWNISGVKCAEVALPDARAAARWDSSEILRATSNATSTLGAVASEAAYVGGAGWLATVVDYIIGNRDVVSEFVRAAPPGIGYIEPSAAYLAWLGIPRDVSRGHAGPAEFLLRSAGVSVSAGVDFGEGSRDHVRLNYATARPVLREALTRISDAIASTEGSPRRERD